MRRLVSQTLAVSIVIAAGPAVIGTASAAESATPADSRTAKQSGGKWQLSVDSSADGSRTVSATLPAEHPIPSGFDEVTPKLVLRYRGGRASAYVLFDTFLGSGRSIEVTLCAGDTPGEQQSWRLSDDGRAAFVPGDALAFIQRLKQVKTLSVEATPPKANTVRAVFDPEGIEVVVKALIAAGVKYGS